MLEKISIWISDCVRYVRSDDTEYMSGMIFNFILLKVLIPMAYLSIGMVASLIVLFILVYLIGVLNPLPKLKSDELAEKNYFFSKAYRDALATVKQCLRDNTEETKKLANGWWNYKWFVKLICPFPLFCIAIIWTFGLSVMLVLILVFVVIMFAVLVSVYDLCLFVLLCERGRLLWHGLHAHCKCGRRIFLPVYECCSCGAKHHRLIPGKYGIFRRECKCGELIPTTLRGRRKISSSYKPKEYCPHCDSPLLQDAINAIPISIALSGSSSSGKTTCMAALAHRMMGNPSPIWPHLSVKMPDERDRNEMKKTIKDIRTTGRIDKTNFYSDKTLESCKFDCKTDDKRPLRRFHIYDPAGESFRSEENIEEHKHYGLINGLMILVDLNCIKKGSDTARLSGPNTLQGTIDVLLDHINKTGNTPHKGKQFAIPCAVVLTKVDDDSLRNRIWRESQELMTTLDDIHNECIKLMEGYGLDNEMRLLKNNFHKVRFFAISALGIPLDKDLFHFSCGCGRSKLLKGDNIKDLVAGETIKCDKCGKPMTNFNNSDIEQIFNPVLVEAPLNWILSHHSQWVKG